MWSEIWNISSMNALGKSSHAIQFLLAVVVFVLGLGSTAVIYQIIVNSVHEREQVYFEFRAREAVERIKSRMAAYQQVLRGTAGIFNIYKIVDRHQFRDYYERQALERYLPGIQGIGFAKAIHPLELQVHIEQIRAEGFPSYSVLPEGQRDLYSSIIYLEPFSGRNLRAFGYDMYSEPVRRFAMQRSIDTGEMMLSGWVRLQQEVGVHEQTGFLIYQAVYDKDLPAATVAERRASLLGWVYAPFRMTDFLEGLMGEQERDLVIDIFDGKELRAAAQTHFGSLNRDDVWPEFESVHQLDLLGQTWTLRIQASKSLLQRVETGLPRVIVLTGVMLSGMLFVLVFILISGRSRVEALAREMTEDLSMERARLNAFLEGTRVGTWEWHIQTGETVFNHKWAKIIGYKLEELEPISIETWIKLTHPDDFKKSEQLLKQHFLGETPFYECEARMRHKDGHWVWVLDRGKVGKWDDEGKPIIIYGTHQDITRSKLQLETYHRGAYHDVLTDLPNRQLFNDRISQALALAEREKTHLAVFFMDLDGFKTVNDIYGHEAGDVVLKTVANRIEQCIRASDTLARFGGDEFVVLLQDIVDEQEAIDKATKFIAEVKSPISLPAGSEANISMSVGIALYPQHGITSEQLCKRADQAMYQVKKGSKNGALVYQNDDSI
ncbi:CHASE domain-containing protein [Shewanella oncorhynchi]|uniref:CHASE domain-containing protein n=3 Tax=Shewanella oncorhynchi TaxID=2726434 RepID=UPI003D7AAFAD